MNDFEDSRYALYNDPNAYIQKNDKNKDHKRTKIVFQEPYECMPNYYCNNDFKKHDCYCGCNRPKKEDNVNFPFDLKKILPFLSSLGNGGGLRDILKIFNTGGKDGLTNILSSLGNGGGISNIISSLGGEELGSLLKGLDISKLFQKKSNKKTEMKSSEINIKDYTRVE